MKQAWAKKQTGFTIVELLIVIVVIGILAAITIVAYNGIQERANESKIQSDLAQLEKAIQMARTATQQTLHGVTGFNYTAGGCMSHPVGTDLADLPQSDACWARYNTTLERIGSASGMDISGLVDPWGRPYAIDENEGERGGCAQDSILTYGQPFNQNFDSSTRRLIPLSGFSGC